MTMNQVVESGTDAVLTVAGSSATLALDVTDLAVLSYGLELVRAEKTRAARDGSLDEMAGVSEKKFAQLEGAVRDGFLGVFLSPEA